jgi:hypothetical protein
MNMNAMTSKRLTEAAQEYFNKRKGGSVSISDLCAAIGISLEEWQTLGERKGLRQTVKRIETKVRAMVENDLKRPATITSLLLKQLADEESGKPKVEFVLTVNSEQ